MMVREVFASLRTISQQGVTIVLVEQNVPHALALADRAFVLETGRVTLSGRARDLVNDSRIRDGYLGAAAV
jgi:branched-chain amino acid transport system ATP-binding protein